MMGNTVQKGLWLDPRAKLFLILMCVLSSMFAPSLTYQFALVLLIAVLGVLCGKWKYAVKGVCFYALVCVLTVWIMAAMMGTLQTMFVAFLGLFHKVYGLRDAGRDSLVYNKGQRIFIRHEPNPCPEKICHHICGHAALYSNRPGGLHFIKDAMRMRDVSPSLGGFLSHPGMTVECIYVPLMMMAPRQRTSFLSLLLPAGSRIPIPGPVLSR